MHENWLLKRGLADGISDPAIDEIYELALSAGASGGKLLGAGGGGLLLFAVPPERHEHVRRAVRKLREIPFKFSLTGTQIVLMERAAI
jgi:D-glycero-alpha-D-manno-heptose-7-phosphate kinase